MKQVIVVRGDLGMSQGKMAVQCCHASYSAASMSDKKLRSQWENEGQKKVVLSAKSEEELIKLKAKADKLKIKSYLVADAGLTELTPGTVTALALGPDDEGKIDKVTGSLPLIK